MDLFLDCLWAFLIGGGFCIIGQLLIELTKLTPARILVGYVVGGVLLTALGVYDYLVDFAGAGAKVPLTGFGYSLAKGVEKATTEYGLISVEEDIEAIDRVSEECRGIGASFGWNRFETVEDYLSEEELIKMLVDLVSKGSNFLLNVGPTDDGRIPVIMEERLHQLGQWLRINGEGIYCSRKYCSEPSNENIKYTKHKDNGSVFAFIHKYPMGKVILSDIDYREGMKVSLLGCDKELEAVNENGKLAVDFGFINPDEMKSKYVYTVKVI